jgi:hypothetical protein
MALHGLTWPEDQHCGRTHSLNGTGTGGLCSFVSLLQSTVKTTIALRNAGAFWMDELAALLETDTGPAGS